MKEFVNRPIGHVSKGMRQRVGLADALIGDPKVLFLDEPTIGLDPTQIRETRNLISELGQQHTILLSSHILSEVEATCSRVIIVARGRVVADGTPHDLSARLSEASRLIAEVKGPEGPIISGVKNLPGVKQVETSHEDGWQRLRIATAPGVDVREQVAKLAADRGWNLRELRREVANLEDYFVKLVAEQ